MSGICDTCKRERCRARGEGFKYCDFYDGGETIYEKLFGTPERAARTLECSCHLLYGLKVDGFVACIGCPVYDKDADIDDCCYVEFLNWLKSNAEK